MSVLQQRFRIQTPGSTSLSTASLDLSFDGSRLQGPITIRHPVIVPQEGRTESQPWDVHIADVGSTFTAQLADSSGRMDLLGRLAYAQHNVDGAGWVTRGAGRITDVYLDEGVAAYRVVVEDERTLEGTALLFNSSNTTRLYPGGPAANYGWMNGNRKGAIEMLRATTGGSTEFWRVTFGQYYIPMPDSGKDAIRGDVVPNPALIHGGGYGNFKHLRLRIGSSDFEVVSTTDVSSTNVSGWQKPGPSIVEGVDQWGQDGRPVRFWIAASSSRLGTGSVGVVSFSSAYLHMQTAPPSPALPLHIGGEAGSHPMQVLKDCYDGLYCSTDTPKVRYSTAAFSTGSTGLRGQPMPLVRFRVTEPQVMREWLEDYLYKPFMVVPTIDASGQVTPRSVKLPNSTTAITNTFTGATLRAPHPTWAHPRRDAITVLRVEHENEFLDLNGACDFIGTDIRATEIAHDRVTTIGRKVHTLQAHGYKTAPFANDTNTANADRYVAYIQRDYFDRFGDGPITGTLYGLSTMESVVPGEFVKVTLGTYPNPSTGARSGTRIVQVLGRDLTPYGPEFPYLDAGPHLQPVASPTISLSSSTADAKHSVRATIGTVPSGGGFNLELAHSATTAHPAAGSQLWQSWETTGRSSAVYRIGRRPSNTKVWARAQATKPNRLRSPWVYSTGKATQKITGPTGFAASSNVGAGRVVGTWSVGDAGYKTQAHIDTSTSAALSTANTMGTVPAATRRFVWEELTRGTKYLFGVRHFDDYGGYSTGSYVAATVSTAVAQCPTMYIAIAFPAAIL